MSIKDWGISMQGSRKWHLKRPRSQLILRWLSLLVHIPSFFGIQAFMPPCTCYNSAATPDSSLKYVFHACLAACIYS